MDRTKPIKQPLLTLSVLFLFAIGMSFSACDEMNLDDSEGIGQINIHLSDATEASKIAAKGPGGKGGPPNRSLEGLEEVNIDVQELRIHFAEAEFDTVSADSIVMGEAEEGEWITIPIDPVRINLMELSSADTLLAIAELEEGFYSELRLILGNDNNVVVNEETHPLKVPSGQQSGYKIKFGESLSSGELLELTIEFDAERSVHVTGNGQYMLKPVLHAFEGRTNGNGNGNGSD